MTLTPEREQQLIALIGRVADLEAKFPIDIGDIEEETIISPRSFIYRLIYTEGWVTLWDESGKKKRFYNLTQFGSAITAAGSGDIIEVSAGTITGDHTIPDGVRVVGRSRYATVFTGQITGGDGASIENLSIERSANDATTLIGVDSPGSGTFYIHNCDIEADQSGSGDAYGISADVNNTIIEVWNSYLYGNSGSGSGYGAYRDTGTSAAAYLYGGRCYGNAGSSNV